MDILIKNIELPKEGFVDVIIRSDGTTQQTGESYRIDGKVPTHGRLGDLDRLERMFADIDHAPYSGFDGEEPFYSAEDAAQIIRLAPTIIPASKEGET